MSLLESAKAAKQASIALPSMNEETRTKALKEIAQSLRAHTDEIMKANQQDVNAARANHLSDALINRLALGVKHIEAMAQACEEIARSPQVVGQIVEESVRDDGLMIQKQRIPIGVIGMIFESRPNVVIDGSALAIKSGNAIILKGGKEAQHSNKVLFEVASRAIANLLPAHTLTLLETREEIDELLKLNQYVDLMVPRGGEKLIQHVRTHATMPVVAHDRGLCHVYLHQDASLEYAQEIVLNAKTHRPGVCNAMETLLIHEKFPEKKWMEILETLKSEGVEIYADEAINQKVAGLHKAKESDFNTEWLDKKMSARLVKNEDEAIAHIQKYGSHHTEAIIAQNTAVIEKFLNAIDASCLAINASTRFNDGGELGLGAELGISTSKLHAYGPMGAREMTTTRFIVRGKGHVRS
ncbi:MAG: glutamate-5-semialdehyde dehydrogenase [Bacteriovoracaceae bacterium]|nr:glutamate-5-semialdehyde dehydrogenase [Bacteriovoracaceae bacterium]